MSQHRLATAALTALLGSLALTAHAQSITIGPANGLKFNLTPTFDIATGNGPAAYQDFQAAALRWSSLFTDNITINLTIGLANLGGGGIIGQTGAGQTGYSYSSVRTALTADRTSVDDFTAVTNLPAGTNLTERINRTSDNPNGANSATPYTVSTGAGTSTISMTNANAKALGIYVGSATANDATITFNSQFAFDYDEADGVDGNKIDFLFVATHEIGHSLGFISGVDDLDYYGANGPSHTAAFYTDKSTLDLFRYSADSFAQGKSVTDFTAGASAKYFSIDGGVNGITTFSTGGYLGDGSQASHWKDNIGAGIMDPTASYGEIGVIRQNDIRAFDVIGYNLAAPEPSQTAALGLGVLGLAGLAVKARKRRTADAA